MAKSGLNTSWWIRYTKRWMISQSVPRILVVYKKSAYQLHVLERKDVRLVRLLRTRHPDVVDLRQAHDVHARTLKAVARTLDRVGLRYDLVYRADLRTAAHYDLVICVGGDGTLLQTAHLVGTTPILGGNSDPARSEAVFCAATRETFEPVLQDALAGRLPQSLLYRLRMRLNGRPLPPLALNDLLIAHEDPATMSRYRLAIGAREETQKSSGLWVATAAGSSSAIFAAGGRRLAWTAKRFQYRPRELYRGRLSRYRLTGGILPRSSSLRVTWLMREGMAYVDGPHVRHPLRFGDRLAVELSPSAPLRLLGLPGPA